MCTPNETLEEWLDRMDKTFGKQTQKKTTTFNEHSFMAHSTPEDQHKCLLMLGGCGEEPK